jgi:hypothetical protein
MDLCSEQVNQSNTPLYANNRLPSVETYYTNSVRHIPDLFKQLPHNHTATINIMSDTNTQQQYASNNNNTNSTSQFQSRPRGFMSGGGLLGIRGRRQDRRDNRRNGGGRQRGFGIISGIREAITNRGGNGDQNQEGSSG